MTKWEYAFFYFQVGRGHKRIVTFSGGGAPWEPIREDEMLSVFHRLGELGWEFANFVMAGDTSIYFFKRPKAG